MDWFQKTVRQTTSKLILRVYIQKVLKIKNRKSANLDLDRYQEFFNTYLDKLEKNLSQHTFLTGKQMTYVDIMIYVEIHTITSLYEWRIQEEKHPSLLKWY